MSVWPAYIYLHEFKPMLLHNIKNWPLFYAGLKWDLMGAKKKRQTATLCDDGYFLPSAFNPPSVQHINLSASGFWWPGGAWPPSRTLFTSVLLKASFHRGSHSSTRRRDGGAGWEGLSSPKSFQHQFTRLLHFNSIHFILYSRQYHTSLG